MSNLIIGGTGTLGTEVAKQLLARKERVTIFSRDELKQKITKAALHNDPRVTFVLGDVRDYQRVRGEVKYHDNIYLFAALKHVDWCEYFPQEAVKTNVLGTMNVVNAIKECGRTKRLTFSSTDKAVMPINAYGHSKALAEGIVGEAGVNGDCVVRIARYGNVLGSRGSVVDMFAKSLRLHESIKVTDVEMTRFWIKIEDAARFVIDSEPGLNIPDIKASKVTDLARAIAAMLQIEDYGLDIVGLRPGEKLHESLSDGLDSLTCPQYTHEELKSLLTGLV